MECTEFRELMEADPAATDPRAGIPNRPFRPRTRLRASERLINAALRFDVAALQANVQQQRNPAPRWRFTAIAGTAAALVGGGVGGAVGAFAAPPPTSRSASSSDG